MMYNLSLSLPNMGGIAGIHWKRFEKFLLSVGCTFRRERGDHRMYYKTGLFRPIVIPHQSNLNPDIISNALKALKISTPAFLEMLKDL